MKKALKEIATGFNSLVTGLRITMGQFFKPSVTVQYPHETLPIPARFRGHIELVRDPETGKAICFACKLCERACPSDCIVVEGAKLDGAKKKSVTEYKLDFTKCSLCGSCVEACRDGAIRYSRDYNLAGLNKEEYIMDLFARLQAEAQAAGVTPLQAEAPQPAAGQGQVQQELRPTGTAQTQTVPADAAQRELRPTAASQTQAAPPGADKSISGAHRAPLQGAEPVKKDAP
jgi:NADH-quinone oxidoreductase subunit I